MRSVCFTGHRQINAAQELKERLTATLETLIKSGAVDFYSGGCCGWDMLCSCAVIVLRKKYPQIKLHLVLPCSNKEQTARWSDIQREWFYKILSAADSVEYTSECYTSDCMKVRNARLVELADCCVCYLNPKRHRSGTYQTYKMAQKKGIEIHNLYDDEVTGKAVNTMLEEQGRELEEKYKDYPDIQPSDEYHL